jgi:hypothetical protein
VVAESILDRLVNAAFHVPMLLNVIEDEELGVTLAAAVR